jgi:hypothetical protein
MSILGTAKKKLSLAKGFFPSGNLRKIFGKIL